MKVLVAFKAVPDPDVWTTGVPGADITHVINPFDAIAIEETLRLKECGPVNEVVAVTIGPVTTEEQVRSALAMGVDRAVRIDDDRTLDPYTVARLLQGVVHRESPTLVFVGKLAVDDDSGQVGPMLAGLLGWPQATFVSKIVLNQNQESADCTRETDSGLEQISIELPAVVTCDLRLNEPRYVSLPGLLRARRRSIDCLTPDELGVHVRPPTTILGVQPAPRRAAGTIVESVEQLMARLHNEAKVL